MAEQERNDEENKRITAMELDNTQELMKYAQKHVTWTQIIGGSIGNILEWYDFAVFGFLAQPIGTNFFPSESSTAELIQAYGVFAGAFIARPIGGIVFGILGDKMGRKLALQISMAMMFLSTFIMGCLPTYSSIGMVAPILLTILRLFQGLSVGGQLVGSMLFLVESSKVESRGFYGSLVMTTATIGTMSGAWVASIFEAILSDETMNKYGWRIPFLLSCVIGLIGFMSQYKMDDSHEFKYASKSHQIIRNPLNRAVCKYWREIMFITLIVAPWSSGFYICYLWLPTHLEHQITPTVEHAFIVNSFMFIWICICLLFGGYISDKYTYFKTMRLSVLYLCVVSIFTYWIVQLLTIDGQVYPLIIAQFILGFGLGNYGGPMQVMMVDCVDDVVVRYCVMGIGYNLCQAIFGGTAPIFAALLSQTKIGLIGVGIYFSIVAFVALIVLSVKVRQTEQKEILMIQSL
eukprot:493268_1